MQILIKEKLSEHKMKTPEGFLICTDAILARTGSQQYMKSEVFPGTSDSDMIDIHRHEEDVFSKETLASFENKPVTWDHPSENVTPDNYRRLSVGYVRNVRKGTFDGQPVMIADIIITDADAIKEILDGNHTELSCGYDCDIIQDGDAFKQSNIRGNHVALCEQGRAGIAKLADTAITDVPSVRAVAEEVWEHLIRERFSAEDILNMIKKQDSFAWAKLVRHGHSKLFKSDYDVDAFCKKNKSQFFKELKYWFENEAERAFDIDELEEIGFYDSKVKTIDTARTLTVQCYIFNEDATKVLIQNRTSSVWHGLAVPGGHVKADERPIDACIREIKEETGLDVRQLTLFGTHNYECEEDGPSIALLYKTRTFSGELHSSNEGNVEWMDVDFVLSNLNCAKGFQELLVKARQNNFQVNDNYYGTLPKERRYRYKGYVIVDVGYSSAPYSIEGTGRANEFKTLEAAKKYIRENLADSIVEDRPEGYFKQLSNALRSYVVVNAPRDWTWRIENTAHGIVCEYCGDNFDYGMDPAEAKQYINLDRVKNNLQQYLTEKCKDHITTIKSASFIKSYNSNGGIIGIRFNIAGKLKQSNDSINDGFFSKWFKVESSERLSVSQLEKDIEKSGIFAGKARGIVQVKPGKVYISNEMSSYTSKSEVVSVIKSILSKYVKVLDSIEDEKKVWINSKEWVDLADTPLEAELIKKYFKTGWYNKSQYNTAVQNCVKEADKRYKASKDRKDYDAWYTFTYYLDFDEFYEENERTRDSLKDDFRQRWDLLKTVERVILKPLKQAIKSKLAGKFDVFMSPRQQELIYISPSNGNRLITSKDNLQKIMSLPEFANLKSTKVFKVKNIKVNAADSTWDGDIVVETDIGDQLDKMQDLINDEFVNSEVVYDSTFDAPAKPEEVDTANYVVGKNGVWFARAKGEKSMLSKAFCSADKGKTWHTCNLETKTENKAHPGQTQAGKYFFRTSNSKSYNGPRVAMGRNVLTWYAANGIHEVDSSQQIDHVDGNYKNDNLSNLERVSIAENIKRMKAKLGKDSIVDVLDATKATKLVSIAKIVAKIKK